MGKSEAGKGDDRRPLAVPRQEFERRWDLIDWTGKEKEKIEEEKND